MYATVKGKTTYTKKNTVRARVNPRNSDARKNTSYQAIGDKKTQEKREKIKEKNTQYPKKETSPMESPILLQGKSFYG
jgi:hypothetical protein